MSYHSSRGFAAEKVFVDAWKAAGFTFERNNRSDRMKKFNEGTKSNPELVETLEAFIASAVTTVGQNGHDRAIEAPLGFRMVGSSNSEEMHLRLHLNNKWVKHPRPSPDSKPGLWFGSTTTAAWHQNTRELWGGEEGGLIKKHVRGGYKTWTALRAADKVSADHLITLMRDALFEECNALTASSIKKFISYLGLGEDTMHICLHEDDGIIETATYGAAPTEGSAVSVTKVSHDRITLQCGEWEFALRVHNADAALKASSFKVEVDVPSHP